MEPLNRFNFFNKLSIACKYKSLMLAIRGKFKLVFIHHFFYMHIHAEVTTILSFDKTQLFDLWDDRNYGLKYINMYVYFKNVDVCLFSVHSISKFIMTCESR